MNSPVVLVRVSRAYVHGEMGRVEPVGPTPMITLVLNANNIASDIIDLGVLKWIYLPPVIITLSDTSCKIIR